MAALFPPHFSFFLSGISFALVTERLREKGATSGAIAKTTIRRGAEIFGLGLLFRVQEYVLGYGYSPWTDLLRVDVLNILGLSMMLMGILCWISARRASDDVSSLPQNVAASRTRGILASLLAATMIAMVTPLLWTTHRHRALPWPLESYINGVHIYGNPQPWLFPLFPWAAFAFAGLAVGFFLFTNIAKRHEGPIFAALGAAGILACWLSIKLDASPHPSLRYLRLLAHQPEFFPDALRHPPDHSLLRLRVVPLGRCPNGFQSHHPARQDLSSRLLGAHRIRLRPLLHPPQAPVQRPPGHDRPLHHLRGHAGTLAFAHQLEKPPCQSAHANAPAPPPA